MAYGSGKKRYLDFCTQFQLIPLPTNETILLRFVAFLSSLPLSYPSIRSYLSAVRHLQITSGFPDPALESCPRLVYALKGVRRQVPTNQRQTRLPITPEILFKIFKGWSRQPPSFNKTMLWAAFCLGFFGFMRAGEFTCASQEAFTPDMLSAGDIAVDSHSSPSYLVVHLQRSKNDPFAVGTRIHLGATGNALCPVVAILGYLAIRPSVPGPLFIFENGATLSRPRLVQSLRLALQEVGVDDSGFSGHSFRIGAATTAARAGLGDALIKTLGRWRSAAYQAYIRTPGKRLASFSATLTLPAVH